MAKGFHKFIRRIEGLPPVKQRVYNNNFVYTGTWSATWMEALRKAISGEYTCLVNAFSFRRTPQGDQYWYDRAYGNSPVTEEDLEYMRWIRDTHGGQLNG